MKIGVYGGAFDPPHLGHKGAIEQALQVCDRVLIVPSIAHGFGKRMSDFEVRYGMVMSLVDDLGDPRVSASAVERDLWDGAGPVCTIDVLRALKERQPEVDYVFVCGPDNAERIEQFKRGREIRDDWGLVALEEQGVVRSTLIRKALGGGQSAKGWMTPRVERMVRDAGLYLRS